MGAAAMRSAGCQNRFFFFFMLLAPIELDFETITPPKEDKLPILVYRVMHGLLACNSAAHFALCGQCWVRCLSRARRDWALLGKN